MKKIFINEHLYYTERILSDLLNYFGIGYAVYTKLINYNIKVTLRLNVDAENVGVVACA